MFHVGACDTLPALEALRAEWDDLLNRSDHASIFSTWEWVDACWRFPAPGRTPLVFTVRNEALRLVAVLPLAATTRFGVLRTYEVLGCTHLGYPMGDYGGLVAERGAEEQTWYAILKHMKARRWGVLDMRNCMVATPEREEQTLRAYSRPADSIGLGVRVQTSDVCRNVALPATFEEFLASLSSNSRQNMRRKMRKLTEAGITIAQVDGTNDAVRDATMDAFYAMHQDRWEEDSSGGGFPEGRVRDLHRYLARSLGARGYLDLRAAYSSEGEIIGVIYNFRYDGTCYYYHMGAQQEGSWAPYSLGTCLLIDSIRAAIEGGCHHFDLLRGDHEYKRHFGGYSVNNLRVVVYRYGWLPRAEVLAQGLKRRLKGARPMQLEAQP